VSLYGLTDGLRPGRKHIAVVSASVTGTGAVATGLMSVDGAQVTPQNSATTIPSNFAAVTSLSGGTVNCVVNAAAAAANAISAVAATLSVLAVGA